MPWAPIGTCPVRDPLTRRDLFTLVYAEAGRPLKARPTGRLILRAVGLLNPAAREMVEMLYEFEKPYIVDSSRFQTQFGLMPTPTEEAVRKTVTFYRDRLNEVGVRRPHNDASDTPAKSVS